MAPFARLNSPHLSSYVPNSSGPSGPYFGSFAPRNSRPWDFDFGPRDVDFYILICLNDRNLTCLDLSLVLLAGHFFPRSIHEISTLGVYFSNSCLCPFSSCCELVFICALWTSIFHFHVGPNFDVFLPQNSVFNFESEPCALGTSIFPF